MSAAPPPREAAPPPSRPRISETVVDAPTQRFYLAALFALVQTYKLQEAFWPGQQGTSAQADELPINWRLWKWIAIDLVFVAFVAFLRVPRLVWGWKARWISRLALCGVDYVLFGRWTLAASIFVPTALRSFFVRTMSTDEHSVRLVSIMGSEKERLGQPFTVRVLAVSTAMLNPLSTVFCRHASRKSDPTLVPLIFNNTAPAKVTYTVTTFDDPPRSHTVTVPASSLVRRAHPALHRRDAASTSDQDDERALASEWSLAPSSPSSQQVLRHTLPDEQTPSRDKSDPFGLSPSESLYFLPITTIGSIRLDSIVDSDGHPIRIRRKRTAAAASVDAAAEAGALVRAYEETRILRCPTAGFSLSTDVLGYAGAEEEHRCLAPNQGVPESWPLGLVVSGTEPMSIRWYSREGDEHRGARKEGELAGIVGSSSAGSLSSAIVPVPLNASLSRPGRTTYYVDSVKDAAGNTVSYSGDSKSPLIEGTVPSRSVMVHRPPEVAFIGDCARGEEVHLLRDKIRNKSRKLQLRLSGIDEELQDARARGNAAEFHVDVRFVPEADSNERGWTKTIQASSARAEFDVDQPGTYEIVDVNSEFCAGAVLVPNSCSVVVQPVPTLETSFTPVHDVCNAETGMIASLHLTGAPPFAVHYTVTGLSGPGSPRTMHHTHRVSHSRDEIRFEPGPGEWEYQFKSVDDAFYRNLPLEGSAGLVHRQSVPVVGDAKWRNAEQGKTVHSCEGETVQVEVELQGVPPWEIEYSVVGQKTRTISGIAKSPHAFDIEIPSSIAKHGGQFALSLESVRDGNTCRRPLATNDLLVEVRRTKPTARFHGAEGSRSVLIRDGESAKIPLRLSGERPWTITYQPPAVDGRTPSPVRVTAQQPNADIEIKQAAPGVYTLVSVRDKYCPGDVSETEWKVETLPRPTLRMDESLGKLVRNGSLVRPGVCANEVDSVPVLFDGKAPFKATYVLQKGSHHGESRQHVLQAIQSRADLTLYTASAGHHTYTFTGVSDSLYADISSNGLAAPRDGKPGVVRLEQDVFALPSAYFSHGAKRGFCVNDELASRGADDLVVRLEGAAPFEVELEVREDGHRHAKRYTVPNIQSHDWAVTLPYGLKQAATHSIAIRRVKDAHGCETLVDLTAPAAAGQKLLVPVPVAEIATIQPVSTQTDHCVGDFLDFVVQGAPPFTVKYEFDGKQHTVPLTSAKFQRLATKPGTFRILSVGHGEDQCRSNQVDIVKKIHPLPSASVNLGDSSVIDIREGEQAEVQLRFTGTPPFSFTYSRRSPHARPNDRAVLETQTVTGHESHEYSIFTSQEGTWSVSFIADAFCSYPSARQSAVTKA
ncbi:hypothetical protein JCM10908_005209 [Rhodotorula pacifica]|uniref:Pom152p n=1 Tax=Rhodotorula pacifica TaxID=1495444 RepID=UPI003179533A